MNSKKKKKVAAATMRKYGIYSFLTEFKIHMEDFMLIITLLLKSY